MALAAASAHAHVVVVRGRRVAPKELAEVAVLGKLRQDADRFVLSASSHNLLKLFYLIFWPIKSDDVMATMPLIPACFQTTSSNQRLSGGSVWPYN